MKTAALATHHLDLSLALEHLLEQVAALSFQPKAVVMFTAQIEDPAPLVAGIYAATRVPMVGTKCTGVGSHLSGDENATAVLVAFGGDDCIARTGLLDNVREELHITGDVVNGCEGGRICLAFPDAISASSNQVLQAIQACVGAIPVVGGFSADDWTFDSVAQFYAGRVVTGTAPFLVLGGDIVLGVGNASGIVPISTARLPVVAEGRSLQRIGDQRALDYYLDIVRDAANFGEFPILYADRGRLRCRSPLSVDEKTGVVHCGADIPSDAMVALGSATRNELVAAAASAASQAVRNCQKRPSFAFVVSCAARARRLGLRADEERQAIAAALGCAFSLCYLYGELAPADVDGDVDVGIENNHILVLAMGEAE